MSHKKGKSPENQYFDKYTLKFYDQDHENEWTISQVNQMKPVVAIGIVILVFNNLTWPEMSVLYLIRWICVFLAFFVYFMNYCRKDQLLENENLFQDLDKDHITWELTKTLEKKAKAKFWNYVAFLWVLLIDQVCYYQIEYNPETIDTTIP